MQGLRAVQRLIVEVGAVRRAQILQDVYMPLAEDAWSEGKCGFKIIQYLALGIPAVGNPVGVNKKIIAPGTNGYLCSTLEEWTKALTDLLQSEALRTNLGSAGRKKIIGEYSLQHNKDKFLSLFQ